MQGIHQVEVRRERGRMTVQAIGRTDRGVKYRKQTLRLDAKTTADPRFKQEQEDAVAYLFQETP